MSYKALYRKYRPLTFDEVIGQDHIIETLENIINSAKISHAYLFAGPRGTGKTSIAHIFAREINRNAAGQVTADLLDIIEIDAASHNGVAEIRNLIDGTRYASGRSRYKVYIIDEVHMLTKGAFNAFLKTLEEPPEHIVFILATTEPDKIPITILSRLQRFNFHRLKPALIIKQIVSVLEKEKITYEPEVPQIIAQLARGGMRDALSLVDQAAVYGQNKISTAALINIFGIVALSNQIAILNYAHQGQTQKLLQLINTLCDEGIEIENLVIALVVLLKDFIVYYQTEDLTLVELLQLDELKSCNWTLAFAYQALDIFMPLLTELKFSQVPRQALILALLKLAAIANKKGAAETLQVSQAPTLETPITSGTTTKKPSIKQTNENLKPKKSLVSTDELHLTQEILATKQEEDFQNEMVNEDLLTTQEVEVDDANLTTNATDEIDLVSMFADPEKINTNKTSAKINDEAVINLLMQAQKKLASEAKETLRKIPKYFDDPQVGTYAFLLEGLALIAIGKNFLLVTSRDKYKITQMQVEAESPLLLAFINHLFTKPLHLFAITYEQFERVKAEYKKQATNNSLPPIKTLDPPSIKTKLTSEVAKFGTDIFGDLLKKEEK